MKRLLTLLGGGALVLSLTACGPSASDLSKVRALSDGNGGCQWSKSDSSMESRLAEVQRDPYDLGAYDNDITARKCAAARAKAIGYTVLSDEEAQELGLPLTTDAIWHIPFKPLYLSASKSVELKCVVPAIVSNQQGDFGLAIDLSKQPEDLDDELTWAQLVGINKPLDQVRTVFFNGGCK